MKKDISIIFTIVITALVSQGLVIAKTPQNPDSINIKFVGKQYAMAMQSPVQGLVESALFESIKLQIFAPKHKFFELAKSAENVMDKAKSPELRYKAYIVTQFLHHPEWLNNMKNKNDVWQVSRIKSEGDKLFALLADELQNRHLILAKNDEPQ